MPDLILLGFPIFCAWWINYALLEPMHCIEEERFMVAI